MKLVAYSIRGKRGNEHGIVEDSIQCFGHVVASVCWFVRKYFTDTVNICRLLELSPEWFRDVFCGIDSHAVNFLCQYEIHVIWEKPNLSSWQRYRLPIDPRLPSQSRALCSCQAMKRCPFPTSTTAPLL